MRPVVFVLLCGCAVNAGTLSHAITTSAVAALAAGISRAQGGCVATCSFGTSCNAATGLCDPQPCRGECTQNEQCEQRSFGDVCVPKGNY